MEFDYALFKKFGKFIEKELYIEEDEFLSSYKNYLKASRVLAKVALKKTNFAIFPYGKLGQMVEQILLEMGGGGISVKYRFDNQNFTEKQGVYPLKNIADVDQTNVTLLLCSLREDIYCELRQEVYDIVKFENVIDVFSPSMYFDEDCYFDRPYSSRGRGQYPRAVALEKAAREVYMNKVSGAVAEVGVYQGWFSHLISRMFPDRTLYLFDTFQGFDDRDVDNQENEWSERFRSVLPHSDASVNIALKNIPHLVHAKVKKGYFPDTAQGLEDEKFAFVSLDTDLYKPIYAGLKFFWPRMAPGGYIFVHDLADKLIPGVRKAILDFCKEEKCGYTSMDSERATTAVFAKPLY